MGATPLSDPIADVGDLPANRLAQHAQQQYRKERPEDRK